MLHAFFPASVPTGVIGEQWRPPLRSSIRKRSARSTLAAKSAAVGTGARLSPSFPDLLASRSADAAWGLLLAREALPASWTFSAAWFSDGGLDLETSRSTSSMEPRAEPPRPLLFPISSISRAGPSRRRRAATPKTPRRSRWASKKAAVADSIASERRRAGADPRAALPAIRFRMILAGP